MNEWFIGNLPTNCLNVFDHFVGFSGVVFRGCKMRILAKSRLSKKIKSKSKKNIKIFFLVPLWQPASLKFLLSAPLSFLRRCAQLFQVWRSYSGYLLRGPNQGLDQCTTRAATCAFGDMFLSFYQQSILLHQLQPSENWHQALVRYWCFRWYSKLWQVL